jgi:putative tryptophan/tyrosine transport system substrate-binding protein
MTTTQPLSALTMLLSRHTKRREFMALLGGAGAWPLTARAQALSPIRPLICMLSPLSATTARQNTAAFRSGLRELGYLDGRNATVEVRYADGVMERMASLASELVALKPDVLLAGSKAGAMAAQSTTRTYRSSLLRPRIRSSQGW